VRRATGLLLALAAARVGLHLAITPNDDFFIDELYYLDCSKHLAWGYVDHPPLSIAILALVRSLLGESLFAVRLLPALTGSAAVWPAPAAGGDVGGAEEVHLRFQSTPTAGAIPNFRPPDMGPQKPLKVQG